MNEEITESVYYQRGYDKGFSDAQEKLALEFNRVLIIKEDLAYEKGYGKGMEDAKENIIKLHDPKDRKPKM
jgi:hypothetical protein